MNIFDATYELIYLFFLFLFFFFFFLSDKVLGWISLLVYRNFVRRKNSLLCFIIYLFLNRHHNFFSYFKNFIKSELLSIKTKESRINELFKKKKSASQFFFFLNGQFTFYTY